MTTTGKRHEINIFDVAGSPLSLIMAGMGTIGIFAGAGKVMATEFGLSWLVIFATCATIAHLIKVGER